MSSNISLIKANWWLTKFIFRSGKPITQIRKKNENKEKTNKKKNKDPEGEEEEKVFGKVHKVHEEV